MPQPIDLQTEIARVSAAERIQQVAGRASLAAQQRVASDIEQTRVGVETQIQRTEESRNEQVEEDGRRRNPFLGRRRRKEKGKDAAVPVKPASAGDLRVVPEGTEGHKLDVTV